MLKECRDQPASAAVISGRIGCPSRTLNPVRSRESDSLKDRNLQSAEGHIPKHRGGPRVEGAPPHGFIHDNLIECLRHVASKTRLNT
eukprot:scaffold45739_cov31-Tisochrysis_lutea.AAC.3